MGRTSPHASTLSLMTPDHGIPPLRQRILLPLVVALLAAAAALSALLLRALRLVGIDLTRDGADTPEPVWYPDESVRPEALGADTSRIRLARLRPRPAILLASDTPRHMV